MRFALCIIMVLAILWGAASADSAAFGNMTEACQYVRAEAKSGAADISLTLTESAVNERSTAEIRDILTDALEYCASYEIAFTADSGLLHIAIACEPRPALKMLHAWETGDRSALSGEESLCLDKAIAAADECRAGARSGLAIELAVYEYICRHVSYAHDATAQGTDSPAYRRASTGIGALMDGSAQCQGYAEAFWLIATLSGLDVETQYGWGGGDAAAKHAWNTIRMGNHTYIVDACWGDVSGDAFEPETPDYRCFNVALDRMPEGRRWHPEAAVSTISSTTDHAHSAFSGLSDDAVTVDSLSAAVQYALARHNAGADYAHIFIPGRQITVSQAQDAMLSAIRASGIGTKWGRLAHEFSSGTYLIVRWVHE